MRGGSQSSAVTVSTNGITVAPLLSLAVVNCGGAPVKPPVAVAQTTVRTSTPSGSSSPLATCTLLSGLEVVVVSAAVGAAAHFVRDCVRESDRDVDRELARDKEGAGVVGVPPEAAGVKAPSRSTRLCERLMAGVPGLDEAGVRAGDNNVGSNKLITLSVSL